MKQDFYAMENYIIDIEVSKKIFQEVIPMKILVKHS